MARLGWRERKILLAMLKDDKPKGKPNPVWFDFYRDFKINYNSLPKIYQPSMLCKERALRQTLYRLVKRCFIKPVVVAQSDSSLPSPKAYGYVFYSLTKTGRLFAEKLQVQELVLQDLEALKKALMELRSRGEVYVTVVLVREVLWQSLGHLFGSKEAFEVHWNNTRLGLMLQKCGVEKSQMGERDGRIKYRLCG